MVELELYHSSSPSVKLLFVKGSADNTSKHNLCKLPAVQSKKLCNSSNRSIRLGGLLPVIVNIGLTVSVLTLWTSPSFVRGFKEVCVTIFVLLQVSELASPGQTCFKHVNLLQARVLAVKQHVTFLEQPDPLKFSS